MNPAPLTADDFCVFFRELWGADSDPFPWQREFARRVCEGKAPDYVAVPTGSGKTACLDAAVFALAVQAASPVTERVQGRRIFFIVNRRVIVDEAYIRARKLRDKLAAASPDSALGRVAKALRDLSGKPNAEPLTCVQLRGGIYRDRSWAGSLLQPMIICSTVDQSGSRLLFRGYGVPQQARPIHAALVAQDSLLIIDEAHVSRPFIQTLQWVKRYRGHQPAGCETVKLPFQLIQMTATPPSATRGDEKIMLTSEDYEHPVLKPRLSATKPARLLIEPRAKGKAREEHMARRLVEETEKILAEKKTLRSIAIMVNRVATARSVADKLKNNRNGQVKLLIGRLRPLDRDAATREIQDRLKTGANAANPAAGPSIVVSTQCLEVGADLDFDALVTEAASLDALRQRFGRLNRGGREIAACAVIVLPGDLDLPIEKLDETAPCDSIYGNAIPRTWQWLSGLAQQGLVDFGINAMTVAVDSLRAAVDEKEFAALLSPTTDAPVLLPAYLDCWVQTNPSPAADPEVALFLHGPQRDMADVQVCWRGDLPAEDNEKQWTDVLSLCPPTTAECLPVPLNVLRDWLGSRGRFEDSSSDAVEFRVQAEKEAENAKEREVTALIWRGRRDTSFAASPDDLRPGDTIVLRVQSGGWHALGHIPDAPADPQTDPEVSLTPGQVPLLDIAEHATVITKRRAVLRIHDALWPEPEEATAAAALRKMALDPEQDWPAKEVKALLARLLSDENPGWDLDSNQREIIGHLAKDGIRLCIDPYPADQGFAITTRVLLSQDTSGQVTDNSDTDADALLEASQPQELHDHTRDVVARIETALTLLPIANWGDALIAAAHLHDWGKVDPRFQAMLHGASPYVAMASEVFLAKSGSIPSSAAARNAARERAGLPEYFRHEMLSVQMAESAIGARSLPMHPIVQALALHLIATHHGYGRPFAPLVDDDSPPAVSLSINDKTITVTGAERHEHPAHALDSGIAKRFWHMTRLYGWWGIAFLEAVLRLADQAASANSKCTANP